VKRAADFSNWRSQVRIPVLFLLLTPFVAQLAEQADDDTHIQRLANNGLAIEHGIRINVPHGQRVNHDSLPDGLARSAISVA